MNNDTKRSIALAVKALVEAESCLDSRFAGFGESLLLDRLGESVRKTREEVADALGDPVGAVAGVEAVEPIRGADVEWLRSIDRAMFATGPTGDAIWSRFTEVLTR